MNGNKRIKSKKKFFLKRATKLENKEKKIFLRGAINKRKKFFFKSKKK